jgi:hypothetical protein
MKKISLGDIFEMETNAGLAYLQYVGNIPSKLDIIRILSGLYASPPNNFQDLAIKKEQFFIQFVIKKAASMGILKWVTNVPIDGILLPRYYRTEATFQKTGWEIVDITNSKRIFTQTLSKEEIGFSPYEFWNDTLLKERLAAGWKLEDWV